jgi:hypothetical protein
MSDQITTAFVKQYHGTVEYLLQQKGARLVNCVRNESQNSEEQFWEQIGPTEALEITTRHGDSPQVNTPHDRRRVTLRFFDWGDFIDTIDKVRMLIDPANPYSQNAAYALGRKQDDIIIDAMFGTAFTGKEGATSVSFDSGQQIAANFGGADSGLTITKLIEAQRLLRAAENDLSGEEFYIAVGAKQLANLLSTTQVTSADFNSVKALVQGELNTFMGFMFKHTERLLVDGSSKRRVPVWARSGVLAAKNPEISTNIVQRWDKRGSWYVYAKMGMGATRMQENKIVEIKCSETV